MLHARGQIQQLAWLLPRRVLLAASVLQLPPLLAANQQVPHTYAMIVREKVRERKNERKKEKKKERKREMYLGGADAAWSCRTAPTNLAGRGTTTS